MRQVPVDGQRRDVHDIVRRYGEWLATSTVPKLFVEAVPGVMFEAHRRFARSWGEPDARHGPSRALVPEDAPDEIGSAIADWLHALP
ncbi:MAG: hypothetical protein ABJA74_04270 [Lapillicoccus sp.]